MFLLSLVLLVATGGLLDTCKPDACVVATPPDFSKCNSDSTFCECVSELSKMVYEDDSDACVILRECLIDAACPHVMSHTSQAVVTIYKENTCSIDGSLYTGVLSPADDSCHRIHITEGLPMTGVWCRALCYLNAPTLDVSMYSTREDCISDVNPVVATSFNTVNPMPCSEIMLSNGSSTFWSLNLLSCQHEKYNTPVDDGVQLVGDTIILESGWISNLPSSTGQNVTSDDNGVLTYTKTTSGDLPNYCKTSCGLIQPCRGWTWNGVTGRCELFSKITKGVKAVGIVSGRSNPKYETTCIRWECTPIGMRSGISTTTCQNTCNTQPSHEYCGGSENGFLDAYATLECGTPISDAIFRLHVPADQKCHSVTEADPTYSSYHAALKCTSYGIYIALYDSMSECEASAKNSPPHAETMLISLTQPHCSDKDRFWTSGNLNISWHVQGGSCASVNAGDLSSCRCAAVIEPEIEDSSNNGKCHSYFGILSGTPIIPEENWKTIVPGSRDFNNWWILSKTKAFNICSCSTTHPSTKEDVKAIGIGTLCKNPTTGVCSLPITEGGYVCSDVNDDICDVLPRDSKIRGQSSCEKLCLSVPGCRGYILDLSGRCQLLSELTGIQSDYVTISADCQLSPDQSCSLWQQKPSTHIQNDCLELTSSPPSVSTRCDWTSCHRRVTQSGYIFPSSALLDVINSCDGVCECMINGTKKATGLSLIMPECEKFIDCLQTTNCSDYSEDYRKPQSTFNCHCASSYMHQEIPYNGKCCTSGSCGQCVTWHSRGFCIMSKENCVSCGGTWCPEFVTAYSGRLCDCMLFKNDNEIQITDSSQLCASGDNFGTCFPSLSGQCPTGSSICDQCECSRNCPDAECVPANLFEPSATVLDSCRCVEVANSLLPSAKVVCMTISHPRVCGPAFLNNTCPAGTFACMGTGNSKMVQVVWGESRTLLPNSTNGSVNYFIEEFDYMVHVNMIAVCFLCPLSACPNDLCPRDELTRLQSGCLNYPSYAHKLNYSEAYGIEGDVIIGIMVTRPRQVSHRYGTDGKAEVVTLKLRQLIRIVITDAVDWNYSTGITNNVTLDEEPTPLEAVSETSAGNSNCGSACDILSAVLPGFLIVALVGFIYYLCPSSNDWNKEVEIEKDDPQSVESQQPSPTDVEASPAASPHLLIPREETYEVRQHPGDVNPTFSNPSELEAFPS